MGDFDFMGYATRTNIKCADGRTIMPNAFLENDGRTVPLVYNHNHEAIDMVLGHALLKNRKDGVYAYCKFNDTPSGQVAKECVENGDITHLSIYANQLKQSGSNVVHGLIREVSLVLAGANPGAVIETVIKHSAEAEEEAMIRTTENDPLEIYHAEQEEPAEELSHADGPKTEGEKSDMAEEKNTEKPSDDKTVEEMFDEFTDEQKDLVYALIGEAVKNATGKKEDGNMSHNVFENDTQENVLTHADMEAVIKDAKRYGSMKESAIQHGLEDVALAHSANYGVTPVEDLFPDAKNLTNTPTWISRDMDWVSKVMGGVHHTPFSRIKSMFADITADEARARGYIKGKLKKEEVFSLLKRTTTPTTVYKKQKMDRDDVVDITDFDVIAWIKGEMRLMLNEELARAFLIGDGRLASSEDKINEDCIRPIAYDSDLFTIKRQVAWGSDIAVNVKALIADMVRARKDYKGSGNPVCFTTEDVLTEWLLLEDGFGRRLYKDASEVASAIRCSSIVTVPVMESQEGPQGGNLLAVCVNLSDYNVGMDKGGAVNLFDDFDIDYNQQKYLIETRCSGALIKPYSAMVFETVAG